MWQLWELTAKQPERCYGVTGTNGKGSTVNFLHQIWTQLRLANYALLGFGAKSWPDETIGKPDWSARKPLKRKLHELHQRGVQRVALEYYSANLQHRLTDFVRLSGAAFLNLTSEHLELHGNMENYFRAKQRLLTELIGDDTPTVIGGDCPYGRRLIELRKDPLVFGSDTSFPLHFDRDSLHVFDRSFPTRDLGFPPADIYLLNLLAAIGLATIDGLGVEQIFGVLPSLRLPPGRIERIVTLPGNRPVYSDYAHNADAIARTLTYLKSTTDGRVICVLSWKPRRTDFAEIHRALNRLSDLTIITSDVLPNPKLDSIHSDIENVLIIENRREAITRAMESSAPNDVILACGGHRRFCDDATGRELTDGELVLDITRD